jgi:ABC-2 type transport system ATP-binding protein
LSASTEIPDRGGSDPGPVIRATGVVKEFEQVRALDGLDLTVESGEIFAVLGPNGAGKTTLLGILEGYVERDSGAVVVLGQDPSSAGSSWRQRIGIVLQETSLEPLLTVRESLELYAGYYRDPRPVQEVIEMVGLQKSADVRAGRLSGGQQRRLDVGIAMVGNPDLLFLDEPTTGFDPTARRNAWQMIAGLRDLGTTVLLTTHYMEEASTLADRVAVVVEGAVAAEGSPGSLAEDLPTRIVFRIPETVDPATLPVGFDFIIRDGIRTVSVESSSVTSDLESLIGWARSNGQDLEDLEVRTPTLEDVYMELVG